MVRYSLNLRKAFGVLQASGLKPILLSIKTCKQISIMALQQPKNQTKL